MIGGKTLIEVWTRKPATDHDSLCIFGCPAFFHNTEDSKLDPRENETIFLGFSNGVKGFRLWCPSLSKVVLSRDVTFNEGKLVTSGKKNESSKKTKVKVMCSM